MADSAKWRSIRGETRGSIASGEDRDRLGETAAVEECARTPKTNARVHANREELKALTKQATSVIKKAETAAEKTNRLRYDAEMASPAAKRRAADRARLRIQTRKTKTEA